ncbi:hypothetical protein O3M35_007621 [Rhynocoris fuscipes]|uniref:Ig-like domain-containing protein n=1 Tax=Rhynocoris fuscipes TaxID=488301 RepID=A0AAW1DBG8_9HEMI
MKLLDLRVDRYAIRGGSTVLECIFDLQGESLYSVKWYKDGAEFYRFTPRDNPPAQMFPVPGVNVKLDASNETHVLLRPLGINSTGRYRCEVSGEAPSFQTVSDHRDLLTIRKCFILFSLLVCLYYNFCL